MESQPSAKRLYFYSNLYLGIAGTQRRGNTQRQTRALYSASRYGDTMRAGEVT